MELAIDSVRSLDEASDAVATHAYDLALIDLDDVSVEGAVALPQLRAEAPAMQVLVCGSANNFQAVATAMHNGAHDFILRPMRSEEMRLRILRACSQDSAQAHINVTPADAFGPIKFDHLRGEVLLEGNHVELTPRERSVLQVLVRSNGNIVSKDTIADKVFSMDDEADPKAIETYIHRLRRKVRHPLLKIETVRGLGYRLNSNVDV